MAWMSKAEKLKRDYTDKYVVVDATRPELHRFRNFTGFVKTVNMNGRALVEFGEDNNIGWYDIELDFLKVVDKPEPKEPEAKAAKASPVKKEKTKQKPLLPIPARNYHHLKWQEWPIAKSLVQRQPLTLVKSCHRWKWHEWPTVRKAAENQHRKQKHHRKQDHQVLPTFCQLQE